MSVIVGLLSAVLGVGLFLSGFWFGKVVFESKQPVVSVSEPSEEEMREIREERERLIAEHNAFKDLMSYGAEQAYGSGSVKEQVMHD